MPQTLGIIASHYYSKNKDILPVSDAVVWFDSNDSSTILYNTNNQIFRWLEKSNESFITKSQGGPSVWASLLLDANSNKNVWNNPKSGSYTASSDINHYLLNATLLTHNSGFTQFFVLKGNDFQFNTRNLNQTKQNHHFLYTLASSSVNFRLYTPHTGSLSNGLAFNQNLNISSSDLNVIMIKGSVSDSNVQTINSTSSNINTFQFNQIPQMATSANYIFQIRDSGQIGELICFNRALVESEWKTMLDYICTKWSINNVFVPELPTPTVTPIPAELQPDTLPPNPEPFSDDGLSWTTSSSLPVGTEANYFSSSEDRQYQIVSDASGYLKVSSNNGTSWSNITSLPQGSWACAVVSRSGEIMIATRGDNNIYVSNDYGQNWTTKPVSSPANNCDMSYNGLYQIVIGNNGEIHRSSNYGSAWNTITLPEGVSPSFVDQISMSRNGLVCLVGGSVPYFSLDAGNTWTSTNLSEGDWRALTCSSSDGSIMYAWNFDNNHTIWKSTNFGANWTELTNTEVIWGSTMQTSYDGKYAIITTIAQNRGVFVTKDFGSTWNVYQNNLGFNCIGAYCGYSGINLGFAQLNTSNITYGQWS